MIIPELQSSTDSTYAYAANSSNPLRFTPSVCHTVRDLTVILFDVTSSVRYQLWKITLEPVNQRFSMGQILRPPHSNTLRMFAATLARNAVLSLLRLFSGKRRLGYCSTLCILVHVNSDPLQRFNTFVLVLYHRTPKSVLSKEQKRKLAFKKVAFSSAITNLHTLPTSVIYRSALSLSERITATHTDQIAISGTLH